VTVEVHESLPASSIVESCVGIYRAAFGEPPYSESAAQAGELVERLRRYAARSGFSVPIVHRDGRPVGFALAVTALPGDWWREKVADALGRSRSARWLGSACLEIVHVAVLPDVRRQGVGSQLLGALTSRATTRTALLSCHPLAGAARGLYLGAGWQTLMTDFRTQPGQPSYWLMAKDLRAQDGVI